MNVQWVTYLHILREGDNSCRAALAVYGTPMAGPCLTVRTCGMVVMQPIPGAPTVTHRVGVFHSCSGAFLTSLTDRELGGCIALRPGTFHAAQPAGVCRGFSPILCDPGRFCPVNVPRVTAAAYGRASCGDPNGKTPSILQEHGPHSKNIYCIPCRATGGIV